MLQLDMSAEVRQNFGKGAMRRLRRSGKTPAVLYGPKIDPLALSLETKGLTKELLRIHDQNAVVSLNIEGHKPKKKRHVMIKEIQKDPVQDTLVHADFFEISLEEPTTLMVSVKCTGTPKGVDMGGMLQLPSRKVQIKGLPLDIPDYIEADVTSLELDGPGLICKDLDIPKNVTLLEDGNKVCAIVLKAMKSVDVLDETGTAEEEASAETEGETPPGSEETPPAEEGA